MNLNDTLKYIYLKCSPNFIIKRSNEFLILVRSPICEKSGPSEPNALPKYFNFCARNFHAICVLKATFS